LFASCSAKIDAWIGVQLVVHAPRQAVGGRAEMLRHVTLERRFACALHLAHPADAEQGTDNKRHMSDLAQFA
jgi:hypothetical protein